jgi:hypothetical protein
MLSYSALLKPEMTSGDLYCSGMKFRKTWVEIENRILDGWSDLGGEQNNFRITPNKKKKNSWVSEVARGRKQSV